MLTNRFPVNAYSIVHEVQSPQTRSHFRNAKKTGASKLSQRLLGLLSETRKNWPMADRRLPNKGFIQQKMQPFLNDFSRTTY